MAGLVRFWRIWQFDNKVLVKGSYQYICLKGVHVVCCLWLCKGNYFNRELGFVHCMPERKFQLQCPQQSSQSQQEKWSQQQKPPQLSSTWVCFAFILPLEEWVSGGTGWILTLSRSTMTENNSTDCSNTLPHCKSWHRKKQAVRRGGTGKGGSPSHAPAHQDPSLPYREDNLHRNGPTACTLQTPDHLSHFSHSALAIHAANFHFIYFPFLL